MHTFLVRDYDAADSSDDGLSQTIAGCACLKSWTYADAEDASKSVTVRGGLCANPDHDPAVRVRQPQLVLAELAKIDCIDAGVAVTLLFNTLIV